jgi:hypothetical protein
MMRVSRARARTNTPDRLLLKPRNVNMQPSSTRAWTRPIPARAACARTHAVPSRGTDTASHPHAAAPAYRRLLRHLGATKHIRQRVAEPQQHIIGLLARPRHERPRLLQLLLYTHARTCTRGRDVSRPISVQGAAAPSDNEGGEITTKRSTNSTLTCNSSACATIQHAGVQATHRFRSSYTQACGRTRARARPAPSARLSRPQ